MSGHTETIDIEWTDDDGRTWHRGTASSRSAVANGIRRDGVYNDGFQKYRRAEATGDV